MLLVQSLKSQWRRLKKYRNKISELKNSIEFTQNEVDEKITCFESRLQKTEETLKEVYDYQVDPEYIKERFDEMEDRSRRNNVRVDGIKECEGETREDREKKVIEICEKKLGLENVKIERAHRIKSKSKNGRPRTIICKLQSFKDRDSIIKNSNKLKGTNYYIYEDFSKGTMEYRKELWEKVKKLREKGKIAYLNYCSVMKHEIMNKIPVFKILGKVSFDHGWNNRI